MAAPGRTGSVTGVESPETTQGNSGRELIIPPDATPEQVRRAEGCMELARLVDPEAVLAPLRSVPIDRVGEVLAREERALRFAMAAYDAGYRRVVEDDTTVERAAEAIHAAGAGMDVEQCKPLARAAVRALREGA